MVKIIKIKFEGRTEYRLNPEKGPLHRLDGPAVIWADGTQFWCVEGNELSKEQVKVAQHILKDMPLEDTMMYIGDPILKHFVKYRLDKKE